MEVSASMATNQPFSITSPDFAKRAARMQSVHIGIVARNAAVIVATKLVDPLRAAATASGASGGVIQDIKVHDGHLSDLVMRDHGNRADVIVGVDGHSKHTDEAEELEWGGLDSPPRAWVRTTVTKRSRDIVRDWSNELTRGLDKAVLGR